MTTYVWAEHRARVVAASGDVPNPALEQRVIDVFETHPGAVVAGIDHVLNEFQRGTVRSPWGVLATHVEKLAEAIERASGIVVDANVDRETAVSSARQWIRSAGYHHASVEELRADLFGIATMTAPVDYLDRFEAETRDDPGRVLYGPLLLASIERTRSEGQQVIETLGGPLAPWRDDLDLVREMCDLWEELRPLSLTAEREEQERADVWVASRAALHKPTAELPPIDPDELIRDLLAHAERRVALHATTNPFLDD